MDVFSTREIALTLWAGAALTFVLLKPDIRSGAATIIKLVLRPPLRSLLLQAAFNILLIVLILAQLGLWHVVQLKDTIIWAVFVAPAVVGRAIKEEEGEHLIKHLIVDNLTITAVLYFLFDMYPMNLFAELVFVPLSFVLVAMIAVAKGEKELDLVHKFLNGVLIFLSIAMFARVFYRIATHFGAFAQINTVADFSLTPFLSVMFLPFVYALYLDSKYEMALIRLGFFIKDKNVLRYAKRQAVLRFNVHAKALLEWLPMFLPENPSSRKDIDQSIDLYWNTHRKLHNPPEVDISDGWSPFLAMNFLAEEGLSTGLYHPVLGLDEWFASANPISIGEGILANKISYFISGDEDNVTELKISLNVDDPDSGEEAMEKMNHAISHLLAQSGLKVKDGKDGSYWLEEGTSLELDHATISLRKEGSTTSKSYCVYFVVKHEKHVGEEA